ncbi:hypothetical protein F2P81_015891 [Scophthalmus maximus]|uniref:Uncharacterized protein n=1 Tax=Scophthalmus maximus TaxID=52904 RepID=A0A6A4S800_SCOMX|nr:hypothetical protein F2P81_015891 [Scophthalmus maximus]
MEMEESGKQVTTSKGRLRQQGRDKHANSALHQDAQHRSRVHTEERRVNEKGSSVSTASERRGERSHELLTLNYSMAVTKTLK